MNFQGCRMSFCFGGGLMIKKKGDRRDRQHRQYRGEAPLEGLRGGFSGRFQINEHKTPCLY
jgi:hypothetical protein